MSDSTATVKTALASRYALLTGRKPRTPAKRADWHQEVMALERVWDETFEGAQGAINDVAGEISRKPAKGSAAADPAD